MTHESSLKKRLDQEVLKRNSKEELSDLKADPLMVARRYKEEYAALICALFAYGNAKKIVQFLQSLDFSLLESDEETISKALKRHYYRFQNSEDIIQIFITLSRLKKQTSLETLFLQGYHKSKDPIEGVFSILKEMKKCNNYESQGYLFLTGKEKGTSAYKRWMMFLRWMVRHDELDMGLWKSVDTADLLLPLDTHTFKVGHKLGLLKRKTYDLKAVYEITRRLKSFDPKDPVKYDFALYRLGQEKLI